jgi:hypothetical protein
MVTTDAIRCEICLSSARHRQETTNLPSYPLAHESGAPAKELQQCWFPGVHGNIGGQAEFVRSASDYEEIVDITFAWMVSTFCPAICFSYDLG